MSEYSQLKGELEAVTQAVIALIELHPDRELVRGVLHATFSDGVGVLAQAGGIDPEPAADFAAGWRRAGAKLLPGSPPLLGVVPGLPIPD